MSSIFYKTVRPSYGSFHDPDFKWPARGPVEVSNPDPAPAQCGRGLHLAKTPAAAIGYGQFPFRLLEVRPLSEVLGDSNDKVRVGRAEVIRELPLPDWAKNIQKRIDGIPEEMKGIPWFQGTDAKKAKTLVKTHLKLLTPFGLKIDFGVKVVTTRQEAEKAAAARDAARAAARDAARDAAWDAARDAAEGLLPQPNPFKPLWECWKLGAWPIGFVGKDFIIFVPGKKK